MATAPDAQAAYTLVTGTPVQPERLRERGSGHEAGVAVADGVRARDTLHVAPTEPGVGQRIARRRQPVLHERPAPLAPRVHPGTEDRDTTRGGGSPWASAVRSSTARSSVPPTGQPSPPEPLATGRHFQTRCSVPSSASV